MVPLKVLVIKAVLLLLMGPLVLIGALLGWIAGRAIWRRRNDEREERLRRCFAEIGRLAEANAKALPAGRGDGDAPGES